MHKIDFYNIIKSIFANKGEDIIMKILSADLIAVAVNKNQYPESSMPDVAFIGRSNVGKSSLINSLLQRKSLARISQKPGKTQTINFYLINKEIHFVDLPGYGFAKVPKEVKNNWGKMIEGYLSNRDNLQAVFLLVDIRHEPSKEDLEMYQWLKHYGIPTAIIVTKADKVSRGQWLKHKNVILKKLKKDEDDPIIIYSSENGQGKDELWDLIRDIIDYWQEEHKGTEESNT